MLKTAHSFGRVLARFSDPLASAISAHALSLPDDIIFDDEEGELGREDNAHVTIKYGLHSCDTDEVVDEISGWPPFGIVIGPTSVFHGDGEFVVLKLGVQSRDLVRLNQHISRVFECTDTHPNYNPHATIAYLVKNPKDPYYYQEFYTNEFAGYVELVTEVEFSPAEGPSVTIPLLGADDGLQAMQILDLARDVLG